MLHVEERGMREQRSGAKQISCPFLYCAVRETEKYFETMCVCNEWSSGTVGKDAVGWREGWNRARTFIGGKGAPHFETRGCFALLNRLISFVSAISQN